MQKQRMSFSLHRDHSSGSKVDISGTADEFIWAVSLPDSLASIRFLKQPLFPAIGQRIQPARAID